MCIDLMSESPNYLYPSSDQLLYGLPLHRNTLAQLKDAYTKLFEDYNELKEEKKKREVQLCSIIIRLFSF